MDYSGYSQFPFPEHLDAEERRLKAAFLTLPDQRQLELLQGCNSYHQFKDRLEQKLTAQ